LQQNKNEGDKRMKLKHISILCMIGLSAGLTAQSIILPDQPALTEKTAAEE
jgi:hypothetical protein